MNRKQLKASLLTPLNMRNNRPHAPNLMALVRLTSFAGFLLSLYGCVATPLPLAVSEAQAVSVSKAAVQAQEHAPQAFADAQKLKTEAEFLHRENRLSESAAAGEQALAAYNEAFSLAQLGLAQERLEAAEKDKLAATAELQRLELIQFQVDEDARSFEMQARVALDTEQVKDTDQLSSARLSARRAAARQITAEAALLCLGSELLKRNTTTLTELKPKLAALDNELKAGSLKQDLYPRATELRAACLNELTQARRPRALAAPESTESDELFTAISEAGKYMVYRDDRGIVINLGHPLDSDVGEEKLSTFATDALAYLSATALSHPNFPLYFVVHTNKQGDEKRAQAMTRLVKQGLQSSGPTEVQSMSVESAQPVVSARVKGADQKNERVEVVFVVPGR